MKRLIHILALGLATLFMQSTAFAETTANSDPSMTDNNSAATVSSSAILTINGPSLIEVNTVNVYGFDQYNHLVTSYPSLRYEWELDNAEDPSATPFFMGYNAGHICSFICYEPVTLKLKLDVFSTNGQKVAHGETYITVLPAGSL